MDNIHIFIAVHPTSMCSWHDGCCNLAYFIVQNHKWVEDPKTHHKNLSITADNYCLHHARKFLADYFFRGQKGISPKNAKRAGISEQNKYMKLLLRKKVKK